LSSADVVSRLNIPELFELMDAGMDDAGVDAAGNLYVSDGLNGRVYKLQPGGAFDAFSVIRSVAGEEEESSLNLAVAPDSTFCLADTRNELVVRYSASGEYLGESPAPGVLDLCSGPEGLIYVLSSAEGVEQIGVYDQMGFPVDIMAAPARHRAYLDPGIVSLDCDPEGNAYVSYGMPPYRIWKVKADGSGIDTWRRKIDFPEDAVLIADIALDAASGILWSLLACKQFGKQLLDAFSVEGEFLGTVEIPHSQALYGVICAPGGSELCLLDTGTGPGAGDLMRVSVSL